MVPRMRTLLRLERLRQKVHTKYTRDRTHNKRISTANNSARIVPVAETSEQVLQQAGLERPQVGHTALRQSPCSSSKSTENHHHTTFSMEEQDLGHLPRTASLRCSEEDSCRFFTDVDRGLKEATKKCASNWCGTDLAAEYQLGVVEERN